LVSKRAVEALVEFRDQKGPAVGREFYAAGNAAEEFRLGATPSKGQKGEFPSQ
jgi:hypothetical protein